MEITITKNKKYKMMFSIGMIVFVLSNSYFGWNKTVQSRIENVFDIIWSMLVFIGLLGMVVQDIVIEVLESSKIK